MTYYQKQQEVKKGLRAARRAERALDSGIEKIERELYRLLSRKTLVEPRTLQKLLSLHDEAVSKQYLLYTKALEDALAISAI